MTTHKAVVFGSSGVVGQAIVRLLSQNSRSTGESEPFVTAVSRSGKIPSLADLPGVCCKKGNALNEDETLELCQGAHVIYCGIGLPYHSSTWEKEFPPIVESMLKASEATGAVLIWVDNLYMFGPEAADSGIPMKEASREFTSFGRKPSLRARLDKTMLDAIDNRRCKVAIVRASDFYGPGVKVSGLGETVVPNILKGDRAMIFGHPETKHTYTYVPDLARAVVAVAEAGESAWGRAWHCPSAPPQTTQDVLQQIARLGGSEKPAKTLVLKGITLSFLSIFVAPLRDVREMSFVWNKDYLVDHSDFSTKFPDFHPTPMDTGLKETVEWWRAETKA